MINYFNRLTFMQQIEELGKSRFIDKTEFIGALDYLMHKKIAIIGCGSQGLNQGLNMRDSGLDVVYVLREQAILEKNFSWKSAIANGFVVGTYKDIIPTVDLVINLTPDKQHSIIVKELQLLMKHGSVLGYSHGFHIVELDDLIRKDITVILVAPKSPGTEVREEYKKGFGVPTLIAVHRDNDFQGVGLSYAKGWAAAIGSHRAGVLESSFVAEVKSDLIGEQVILCGLLQACSLFCYNYMINNGIDAAYAANLVQYGWEVISESLKVGGITLMMDRLSNTAKLRSYFLSDKLKQLMYPLVVKHANDVVTGFFSQEMISDWHHNDKILLNNREKIRDSAFESAPLSDKIVNDQVYFDHGVLMISMLKSGIELAFEIMVKNGISFESAYYESLHELPLIANLIARNRLYEMNAVISDTAEYGNYLFSTVLLDILNRDLSSLLMINDLGRSIIEKEIDNLHLSNVNRSIRSHPIEITGIKLRDYMRDMK